MIGKVACPQCGAFTSRVVDVRGRPNRRAIRRRRRCDACGVKFTTIEILEEPARKKTHNRL
jgi:transcriptional repressor NrdR